VSKALLIGLPAACLSASALAGPLHLPDAFPEAPAAFVQVTDKDAMDRKLCKGKYRNVGKCKDRQAQGQDGGGASAGSDALPTDPSARECENKDCEVPEDADSLAPPAAAQQPAQSLD